METAPLKLFATKARTELIKEVSARITAVLAPGSPERVEQPRTVTALERAVANSGGGDKGKARVADKVAYTWFNRIIALRFMDANGYTGIGIVSPAADQVGQPEVLAAAKRGQVDTGVVSQHSNLATINGLLNGTRQPRQGVDAQAEAYALLLAAYCRFWNRALPFMFERESDYTELLIPANLLAQDSVLDRAVKVLTTDVCQDVEVIGWLYQFYIAERKDEVFAGFKQNKKAGADEIPAATQLFTPDWIVRYLVENSLGRLWMLNRPTSSLIDQMQYYIAPVDDETSFLKIASPEELKVIDPACGSGHMLTYAFDLLYAIYVEEGYAPSEIPGLILANNLYGTEIDPRAGALAAFALTMKGVAKRKLFLKSPVKPNICVLEPIRLSPDELAYLATEDGEHPEEQAFWNQFAQADTVGSLIQPAPRLFNYLRNHHERLDQPRDLFSANAISRAGDVLHQAEYLLPKYHVVIANPPYMGTKNMGPALSHWVATNFQDVKADLFSAFIVRNLGLALHGGLLGFMTPFVWMFIGSYEQLRTRLLDHASITSLVQLEYSGFDGATVPICAFTVRNASTDASGTYIKLSTFRGAKNQAPKTLEAIKNPTVAWRYSATARDLRKVPGAPIAFWLTDAMRSALTAATPISERMPAVAGISTGDNQRFFRFWHEVARCRIKGGGPEHPWAPHHKGGPERRWYGNIAHVLRYDDRSIGEMQLLPGFRHDGRSAYFHAHIGWSALTSGRPSFRMIEAGHTFGSGSKAIVGNRDDLLGALAMLNSSLAAELLAAFSPTMNFEVGHIGKLPLPNGQSREINWLVEEAIAISRDDWDDDELSLGFKSCRWTREQSLLRSAAAEYRSAVRERTVRLNEIEQKIDQAVRIAVGVEPPSTVETNDPIILPTDRELTTALVSYFTGCLFGRYCLDRPGLVLANQGENLADFVAECPTPTYMPDDDNVVPIVDGEWFEDDIVQRFRQFLRSAFGESNLEQNLHFVTESLGVKSLRDYFLKSFYKDHVQRYKKRPIYWLFSSPKGSFNALIYMHRYTPSTVSTVLTYLREYVTKLESSLQQAERTGNAKEADRLRKILVELNHYEHDTLYPKASENIAIDLDDGVKANYPKFGAALKKIPGLESSDG